MAMVKANGYGHGMLETAKCIEPHVDMFGVAVMYEGVTLRLAKITKPIAVMMPPDIYDAEKFCECNLEMVACSLDVLNDFHEEARKQGVTLNAHLYIDTGMRRDGIEPHDAVEFMKQAARFTNINIYGVCTHFATSDDADPSFTHHQFTVFQETVNSLAANGFNFTHIHTANSGAIMRHPHTHGNLVRAGLALYGIPPANTSGLGLHPVLTLKTRINAIRRIHQGETVSYGRRFMASHDTTIVTIPIGYGDGYSRLLTGTAYVLIHGKRYPIAGTICMDECMIDVGDAPVSLGDDVVLIGKQGDSEVTATELAQRIHTIPYEITTMITSRVPRIVVE